MAAKQILELDLMSNRFTLFDLQSLNDLQRVFREAKFCRLADDEEITDSPRVAALYEELMTELIAKDIAANGEDKGGNWLRWLMITEKRDEWKVALERVHAHSAWRTYSVEQKADYVKVLLSPFTLTEEAVAHFIAQSDAHHR